MSTHRLDLSNDIPAARPDILLRLALDATIALGLMVVLAHSFDQYSYLGLFALISACCCALESRSIKPGVKVILRIIMPGVGVLGFTYLSLSHFQHYATNAFLIVRFLLVCSAFIFLFVRQQAEGSLWKCVIVALGFFFFSAALVRPASFLNCFLAATFCLIFAHYRVGEQDFSPKARHYAQIGFPIFHFLFVALVSGLLFILFPRTLFSEKLISGDLIMDQLLNLSDGHNLMGFSEIGFEGSETSLKLENIHDLQQRDEQVAKIRLVDAQGRLYQARSMYLRGQVYESYNDGVWTADSRPVLLRDTQDNKKDGWTQIEQWQHNPFFTSVHQTIILAPHGSLCFALPNPTAIRAPRISSNSEGLISFVKASRRRREYQVVSHVPPNINHRALQNITTNAPPQFFSDYLQVDAKFDSLLQQTGLEFEPKSTPWSRAIALRDYLRANFDFALSTFVAPDGQDPVEFFLTEKKQGYCVHFASALALLARAAGLPTRIAAGYHFTGPLGLDDSYNIFSYNAHAWTEIFFPTYGWIICDATPLLSLPHSRSDGETLDDSGDYMSDLLPFNELVAQYDADQQSSAISRSFAFLLDFFRRVSALIAAPSVAISIILILGLLCLCYFGVPKRKRRRLQQLLNSKCPSSSVRFYQDFLWILARHRIQKPDCLTADEFVSSLPAYIPQAEARSLTRRFNEVKFGARRLSKEEHNQTEQYLSKLERLLKHSPHSRQA
jgi:transglutaminase-like putative cysteine protease